MTMTEKRLGEIIARWKRATGKRNKGTESDDDKE